MTDAHPSPSSDYPTRKPDNRSGHDRNGVPASQVAGKPVPLPRCEASWHWDRLMSCARRCWVALKNNCGQRLTFDQLKAVLPSDCPADLMTQASWIALVAYRAEMPVEVAFPLSSELERDWKRNEKGTPCQTPLSPESPI